MCVCVCVCACEPAHEEHSVNNVLKKSKLFFFNFNIFFNKFYIIWNWYVAKIILISQIYLFFGYSKWQQIKQSAPALNRDLSSNFWQPRSPNYMKFTKECVISSEKHILVKNVYKSVKHGVFATNRSGKDSRWNENTLTLR